METFKSEVRIEDEDMQCGHIYLHEPSMMLKFFCLYCEKTYDDINIYCKHLAEHVSSGATPPECDDKEDELYENGLNDAEDEHANNDASNDVDYTNELSPKAEEKNGVNLEEDESRCVTEDSCSNGLFSYTEEELDDDEEESRQFLFEQNQEDFADTDADDDDEFMVNDEIKMVEDEESSKSSVDSTEQASAGDAVEITDFENLIGNAKIIKKPATPPPPKEPEVKTFKIITLKNQIEEIYSLVKKGHGGNGASGLSQKNLISSIKRGIERTTQIIGETVITSQPVEVDVKKLQRGSKKDNYKCYACNKVFHNKHSLSLHRRSHYMESQGNVKVAHKCSECNQLFNKLKELQLHIHNVHYPNGFKCRLCHKVFRSMGNLEVHMRKMHLQQNSFRCRLCGRNDFKTVEEFEEHTVAHGDVEIYKCYLCDRIYSHETNLRNHVLNHPENPGPDRCVVCGKATYRMSQHMKMHTPRPTKLLQCSICNQTFAFSSALSRHTKVMHKLPRTGRIRTRKRHNSINAKNRETTTTKSITAVQESIQPPNSPVQQLINEVIVESQEQTQVDVTEPKKVIVEMIENVVHRKAVIDDYDYENMDYTVARYETIAAVQSITEPTELS